MKTAAKPARLTKAAARREVAALRSQAGAIRAAWFTRGVAEGEFDTVADLDARIATIETAAGLVDAPAVDSLVL